MQYKLKRDYPQWGWEKGETVYDLVKPDYGLARDDERQIGKPCRSVTKRPDGDYPSCVVLSEDLERVMQ